MMRRTAADEPSGPWKARLFWGSTCGRDPGTPCCDEVEDVCDGYQQPVDNGPQGHSPSLPAPEGNEQPPHLWVRGPVLEAMPEDGPAWVMGPYAATAVTTEAMKIHHQCHAWSRAYRPVPSTVLSSLPARGAPSR